MQRLAHRAGNRRKGVRIASERDRVPHGILKALGFERAHERRRHRALARDVEPVGGSDVFDGPFQVVAVPRRDFASHRFRAHSSQGEPDRFGDPHTRALEQFVRVMSGHTCRSCGLPGSERQIGIVQTTLCNACYEAERTEAHERLLAMSQEERVTENKLVIMQTLLKGGADPNYQDDIGQGAVHMAAKSMTRPEAIRILVRGGGDPNLRDNNGWMPLHRAAAIGETPEVIAALAEVGADVNGTGNIEETPLVLAVTSNPNVPITRALIDAGANPDTADSEGRAALHWAARMHAASAIFTAPVEAGADPNQPDNRGRTPVHGAARWHEDRTVVTILIEAGGDPERKDDQGCTALDYMS